MRKLKEHVMPIMIVALLAGSTELAFSSDQPFMKSALEQLQKAAKPNSKETTAKLLHTAKEDLSKAPAIYKGRKASAEKSIDSALNQLKSGHAAEAKASIEKAIAFVIEGIDLVDKAGASDRGDGRSDSSRDYFGVKKDNL